MHGKENLFYIHDPIPKTTKSKALIQSISHLYTNPAPVTEKKHSLQKDDLFKCIRCLFCFGRIIGIIPLSGLFRGNIGSVYFRGRSLGSVTAIILMFGMCVNEVIAILAFLQAPARDASETARNAGALVCYGIGLFVYSFMYRNSEKLMECLLEWRKMKTTFYKEDRTLMRSILLISGSIYTSAILENLVSHWEYFKSPLLSSNKKTGSSVWKNYFEQSHSQYTRVIPYNIVSTIGIFICNKLAVYAWNFGDILIAVLSRGIYKRFQMHLEALKEQVTMNSQDASMWIQAVKDHEHLVDIFKSFAHLISPLIFACTATNIYFICLTLNSFLVPSSDDALNNVHEAWAFLHLIIRTFTAILLCARVHTHAHKIEQILAKCPASALSKEVERTELRLRTSCIGFDGLGCFTITNSFALHVFSVIFTFEIVLLQSTSSGVSAGQPDISSTLKP